jgi:hypothetical protein
MTDEAAAGSMKFPKVLMRYHRILTFNNYLIVETGLVNGGKGLSFWEAWLPTCQIRMREWEEIHCLLVDRTDITGRHVQTN